MSLRPTPPSNPDWGWLGRQAVRDIAVWGTTPHEMRWLRQAYAWLYGRQLPAARASWPSPLEPPQGPPAGLCPVLFARDETSGSLGFLEVEFRAEPQPVPPDDLLEAAYGAAGDVLHWARGLNHQVGWPWIGLHAAERTGGASCGLAALVATLAEVLQLPPPDDVGATGAWREHVLEPVPVPSLLGKLRTARAWGYRRLLVIEGQEGVPASPELEILRVPRQPSVAILWLVEKLWPQAGAEAVAQALAVFDQGVGQCHRDLGLVLQTTAPFTRAANGELVRHLAHDIRARAFLHHGLTQDAAREKEFADACRPAQIPEGWLGDYLEYHQPAYHSMLQIDLGVWEEDHPAHRKLAAEIEHLSTLSHARLSHRLALLFLRNTYGRLLEYGGRFHLDAARLARSWAERTALLPHWPALFAYCEQLRLRDSDLRRQHNQCLGVLASYWEMKHTLPPWPRFPLWVEQSAGLDYQRMNGWDFAVFLQWQGMTKGKLDADLAGEACQWLEGQPRSYPATLVAEKVLRFPGANTGHVQRAAAFLQSSALFGESSGILSILALRAACLLRKHGLKEPPVQAPPQQSPLRLKYDSLAARPEHLLARCPY